MKSLDALWRHLRRQRPGSGTRAPADISATDAGAGPHRRVADSLRALLDDPHIQPPLRNEMAEAFHRVELMLDKLEREELHVAVFGRVSAGKSALCNALLGRQAFAVGVLHGTTTQAAHAPLDEAGHEGLVLIDTPGINELGGEDREQLAFEIAEICDLVIFVADGDLTRDERDALDVLAKTQRPLLLALNKSDRYDDPTLAALLEQLRERSRGRVQPQNIVAVAARPAPPHGNEDADENAASPPAADVAALRERLLAIAGDEGKALSAINAGLFASRLSDQIGTRIAESRRNLANRVIRQYCIAKGVAVALNPVPVADLLAAAGLDAAMVVQLSRVYGLPLTRSESGRLVGTISAQLAALMGAVWGMHLVATALKGLSAGLSVLVTAAAQGALAWYATVLIGRAAEHYLIHGKSWGEHGAKRAVADVVATLDRDSILREAREEILTRLRRKPQAPGR